MGIFVVETSLDGLVHLHRADTDSIPKRMHFFVCWLLATAKRMTRHWKYMHILLMRLCVPAIHTVENEKLKMCPCCALLCIKAGWHMFNKGHS